MELVNPFVALSKLENSYSISCCSVDGKTFAGNFLKFEKAAFLSPPTLFMIYHFAHPSNQCNTSDIFLFILSDDFMSMKQ